MVNDEEADGSLRVESALFAIAWSPDVLSSDEYARLIGILGDLTRSVGAIGVERVRSQMADLGVGTTASV